MAMATRVRAAVAAYRLPCPGRGLAATPSGQISPAFHGPVIATVNPGL